MGKGYALSSAEEVNFINNFAKMEGIILEPAYIVKAIFGWSYALRKLLET